MIEKDYIESILKYIKSLKPDSKVLIRSISNNPEKFTEAVKTIIDNRLTEVEFTSDYQHIIKREEIDYDRYRSKKSRCS